MSATRRRIPKVGRRSRRSTWRRFTYLAARVGLFAVVIGCSIGIAVKLSHPYRLYGQLRRENASDQAKLQELQADNERIGRRIKYLNTVEGQTAQARGQGYHNPDEHPVRTQDPEAKPGPK